MPAIPGLKPSWFMHSLQHRRDFQARRIALPNGQNVNKERFKKGWGNTEAQQDRTRYAVRMCEMNQGGVLANHFGLGFSWMQDPLRRNAAEPPLEEYLQKLFKDFLGDNGAVPQASTIAKVVTDVRKVVIAVTESAA